MKVRVISLICLLSGFASVGQTKLESLSLSAALYARYDLDSAALDSLITSAATSFSMPANGDSLSLVRWKLSRGRALLLCGRRTEAFTLFDDARATSMRNEMLHELALAWLNIGLCHAIHGRYHLAFDALFESSQIFDNLSDANSQAELYGGIAFVYRQLENYERATEFFEKAKSASVNNAQKSTFFELELIRTRHESGKSVGALGQLDSLVSIAPMTTEFLNIYERFVRAEILMKTGDLNTALELFESVARDSKRWSDPYLQSESLYNAGELLMGDNKYSGAYEKLVEAEKISREHGYDRIMLNVYRHLSTYYEKRNELLSLAESRDSLIALKERIYGDRLLVKISAAQAKLETRDDANLVEKQRELARLQEEQIAQTRKLNLAIAAVAVVLVIILVVLYRSNQKKKAFNRGLDQIVREKTRTLEEKEIELQRLSLELNAELDVLQRRLKEQLSTLEGIEYLVKNDTLTPEQRAEYGEMIRKIPEIRLQLSKIAEIRSKAESIRMEQS